MGQRSIAQLGLLDFVMAITLGNIIAHPLSDEGLGLKGSMITMSVLIILYLLGVLLSMKWISFRHFMDPPPIPLIKNGKIVSANLRKARISVDFLLSELRKEKVEDIQKNRSRFMGTRRIYFKFYSSATPNSNASRFKDST